MNRLLLIILSLVFATSIQHQLKSQSDSTRLKPFYEMGFSQGFYLQNTRGISGPFALKMDLGIQKKLNPNHSLGAGVEFQLKAIKNFSSSGLFSFKPRLHFHGKKFDHMIAAGILVLSTSENLNKLSGYSFEFGQYNKKSLGIYSSVEFWNGVNNQNDILLNLGFRTTGKAAEMGSVALIVVGIVFTVVSFSLVF